jgi:hypothetical protein
VRRAEDPTALVVARVIACVSIIVVERVVVVSSVAASSCVAATRSGGITLRHHV